MTPDTAGTPARTVQRPNILTVQGCAGCSTPARQKMLVPAGWDEKRGAWGSRVRTVHLRLKMTRIPNVVSVEARHPRRGPVERQYPTYAKLCKRCRKTAQQTTESVPDLNWLGPTPIVPEGTVAA
ncbi:MAG TPA: hypothetical protein VK573_02785 [Gemmatimonadales bacterium]|nr:hypothetical protein [Gemmatimonadales bacterium]